jgi:predicted PurR-regulated permease PerM
VLYALTISPGKALAVLIVYIAVQQIESNMIIPLVMSRTTRLHPAVIAIGVLAVGKLFGVVGLFVAVPIISAVVILTEETWVREIEAAEARRTAEALKVAKPGKSIADSVEEPPGPFEAEPAGETAGQT